MTKACSQKEYKKKNQYLKLNNGMKEQKIPVVIGTPVGVGVGEQLNVSRYLNYLSENHIHALLEKLFESVHNLLKFSRILKGFQNQSSQPNK